MKQSGILINHIPVNPSPAFLLEMAYERSTWHQVAVSLCQACGGVLMPLGALGQIQWFRCRDCGLDQGRK